MHTLVSRPSEARCVSAEEGLELQEDMKGRIMRRGKAKALRGALWGRPMHGEFGLVVPEAVWERSVAVATPGSQQSGPAR